MFDPVVIAHADARYRDLLQEAEAERQVKAGPAEAQRPFLSLVHMVLALVLLRG